MGADHVFTGWLQSRHDEVMTCERQALELMRKGDIDGYREKMRAKAELLADMANDARGQLAGLPQGKAAAIAQELQRFSASAATALDLGSVFYMSALLYPDDYRDGEPDNLEIYIRQLREEGL